MSTWLATFARHWRLQRDKPHGAGKAPLRQALLFSWAGAWAASKWGPNPYALLFRLYGLHR